MITNYDDYLFEQIINEEIKWTDIKDKFNINEMIPKLIKKINDTKNLKSKIAFLTILFYLFAHVAHNVSKEDIDSDQGKVVIRKLAEKDKISQHDILNNIDYIDEIIKNKDDIHKEDDIVKIDTTIINKINEIKPNLLSDKELHIYNGNDNHIVEALRELEDKGENPDYNLVKTIMVLETGMKPTKNSLGFEGYPQTKKRYISWINKKYKTDFTMKDMYDPYRSAQFIYYYTKALNNSVFVKDSNDIIIAYNWGLGRLKDYKNNKKKLPKETEDYVKMLNIIQSYT